MDLFLMKMGSEIIELLPGFKWLSLTEILEEFEKLMIYQVGIIPPSSYTETEMLPPLSYIYLLINCYLPWESVQHYCILVANSTDNTRS